MEIIFLTYLNLSLLYLPKVKGRLSRHYEALIACCIPIIEYDKKILKKYQGLPVLYTKDYSEITPEYLTKMYEIMIFKKYNFSKLYLSFYSKDEIEEIKDKGNYWCDKLMNLKIYN